MRTLRTLARWITLFALALFVTVFAFQNTETVSLKFLNRAGNFPVFVALLVAFFAGVLLTGMVSIVQVFRTEAKLRKARRMHEMLEREIDALRNQPLYEEPPTTEKKPSSALTQPLRLEETAEESEESFDQKKLY